MGVIRVKVDHTVGLNFTLDFGLTRITFLINSK